MGNKPMIGGPVVDSLTDSQGYGNGLTSNLLPWMLSGIVALGSAIYTWIRTRAKGEAKYESTLQDHESRLGKLENATSALSDKMDVRFDRVDSKIDTLVGKLIDHLDHASR